MKEKVTQRKNKNIWDLFFSIDHCVRGGYLDNLVSSCLSLDVRRLVLEILSVLLFNRCVRGIERNPFPNCLYFDWLSIVSPFCTVDDGFGFEFDSIAFVPDSLYVNAGRCDGTKMPVCFIVGVR